MIVLVALMLGLACTPQAWGEVIAASVPSDQPASASASVSWVEQALYLAPTALLVIVSVAVISVLRLQRLRAAPARPNPLSAEVLLVLFGAIFVMGMVGATVGMMVSGVSPEEADALQEAGKPVPQSARIIQMVCLLGGQAVVFIAWGYLLKRRRIRKLDRRPPNWRAMLIGVIGLVLLAPMLVLLGEVSSILWMYLSGETLDSMAHITLRELLVAERDTWFWVFVGLIVFAVPLFEELQYRGLLQEMLKRLPWGRWPAIVATSVLFALMHIPAVEWHALPVLCLLSIGFGWAYERTGRLSASVAMHALFNAANIALALYVLPA